MEKKLDGWPAFLLLTMLRIFLAKPVVPIKGFGFAGTTTISRNVFHFPLPLCW
jgi:hypothetical protein